jgi:hypothetical protein
VFVFRIEEFVSDGFEFAGVYCSSVQLVTLALTDVTAPDVKNEFFMGQKAACRTRWQEANCSDESKPSMFRSESRLECVRAGFRLRVREIFTLLRCYTAQLVLS